MIMSPAIDNVRYKLSIPSIFAHYMFDIWHQHQFDQFYIPNFTRSRNSELNILQIRPPRAFEDPECTQQHNIICYADRH